MFEQRREIEKCLGCSEGCNLYEYDCVIRSNFFYFLHFIFHVSSTAGSVSHRERVHAYGLSSHAFLSACRMGLGSGGAGRACTVGSRSSGCVYRLRPCCTPALLPLNVRVHGVATSRVDAP